MRRFKGSSINIRRGFIATIVIWGLVLPSICFGYSGGSGTEEEPYRIANKADLLELGGTIADYNKCFILMADINMGGEVFTTAIIPETPGGWGFTGTFDGNGHKIINATINNGDSDVGLFGQIREGTVKNLGVENFSVNSTSADDFYYAGCLVGYNIQGILSNCYSRGDVNSTNMAGVLVGVNSGGTISNCNSIGSVNGTTDGSFDYFGGLAGVNSGSISNCYSTVSVSGEYVGGLVGNNYESISNCYSTGTVNGTETAGGLVGVVNSGIVSNCYSACSVNGSYILGGLVGGHSDGIISNCFSKSAVHGADNSQYVGGLVGVTASEIHDCYSTGAVDGGYSSDYLGGLAGFNLYGNISNCYSTGVVTGQAVSYYGGLVGRNFYASISSSYFLNTSGPNNGNGTPLTDAQMKQQSSFIGWDFVEEIVNGTNDIWKICEGTNYPKLTWQIPLLGDFVCPDEVEMNDLAVLCEEWLLEEIPADVWPDTGDGIVNFFDWAIFANQWQIEIDLEGLSDFAKQWLKTGVRYCVADIAPDGGDGIVNMLDFAAFANNWLEGD
jgi:hypothetical protein